MHAQEMSKKKWDTWGLFLFFDVDVTGKFNISVCGTQEISNKWKNYCS